MDLYQLGWNSDFHQHSLDAEMPSCFPARVAEENKDFYKVFSEQGEFLASVTGRIRFHAAGRTDFPAIGDWVLIAPRISERRATIESILPRKTILTRKMAGKHLQEQVIASNIDTIFLVTSLNQDLNLRRMERYLAIAWESGSQPVILLNKSDLCNDVQSLQDSMEEIARGVPIHALSGLTGDGTTQLQQYLSIGKTAAFIGSSGVGKSTIINSIVGKQLQRVRSIREEDDRGRHTTTSRQMILLSDGGIVIDTPGMREIGMWDTTGGVSKTFQELEELAKSCRFRDCRHAGEPGCAVAQAIQEGAFHAERLESYRKLEAELRFIESKTSMSLQREAKANAKRTGRLIKEIYKTRKRS